MADYYKLERAQYKSRVFRVKHAPFENPFRERRQEFHGQAPHKNPLFQYEQLVGEGGAGMFNDSPEKIKSIDLSDLDSLLGFEPKKGKRSPSGGAVRGGLEKKKAPRADGMESRGFPQSKADFGDGSGFGGFGKHADSTKARGMAGLEAPFAPWKKESGIPSASANKRESARLPGAGSPHRQKSMRSGSGMAAKALAPASEESLEDGHNSLSLLFQPAQKKAGRSRKSAASKAFFANLGRPHPARRAARPKGPEKRAKGKKRSEPSAPYVLALSLCVTVFAFSAFKFGQELIPQVVAANEIKSIKKFEVSDNVATVSTPDGKAKTRLLPDWDGLMPQNSDLVGWIYLDGAYIDYPVLQGDDNNYYLRHTFRKASNGSGSIFLDYRNSKSFTDQNTVIYGHSMKTGTMFGKLKNYNSQSTYERDPVISVYTPDKVFHYQIFSAITVDAMYDYRQPSYGEDFAGFLKALKSKSVIRSSAKVGASDRIVTLSTCTSSIENGRFVVFGVLLNPDGSDIDLSKIKP
ncbi:MAG: class B sortase [Eubacteriaceae bacterium]|jgi:sortase B|nr:class B sortase [Eubacteriaceae bacterium]